MKIEYTKDGMKILHPTGVVQVLRIEDLTRLKNSQEQRKARIDNDIALIDTHIIEVQKSTNAK